MKEGYTRAVSSVKHQIAAESARVIAATEPDGTDSAISGNSGISPKIRASRMDDV